ncbi:11244_t:CDS:1, partial [Paraglomus brasilianum]
GETLNFAEVPFEEVHDRDKEESSGEYGKGSIEEFLSAEDP